MYSRILLCSRKLAGRSYLSSSQVRMASSSSKPLPPQVGKLVRRKDKVHSKHVLIKAGVPFVLFSVLAAWVVSNAIDGKLKERDVAKGHVSKSIRQAKMEEEHEEMMERLNKIVSQDFDNTKRIKRPEEILEERRKERQRRNAWHRRAWRAIVGDNEQDQS